LEDSTHNKRNKLRTNFKKFVPEEFVELIVELLIAHPIKFKIVPPRKTKLGDFRYGSKLEKPEITINGNLNPYAFLITTLHEFAHLHTFLEYGNAVSPHGKEWKNNFQKLLLPIIESRKLPQDIEKVLMNSLINVKASSCSDINLSRVLKNYDEAKDGVKLVEELPKNAIFVLNGREYIKGDLRRKRYLCTEMISKRQYLVNALAEVIPIND
jgi:SprT protein